MNPKNISLMNEKLTSDNFEIIENISNTKEDDYNNLITRLKEISFTITLLKEQYLDKS